MMISSYFHRYVQIKDFHENIPSLPFHSFLHRKIFAFVSSCLSTAFHCTTNFKFSSRKKHIGKAGCIISSNFSNILIPPTFLYGEPENIILSKVSTFNPKNDNSKKNLFFPRILNIKIFLHEFL